MEQKRILLVDDEESFVGLLEIILNQNGWEVQTARDADDALVKWNAATKKPQVVATDLHLTVGSDGLELGKKISASSKEVKIIIMSGYFSERTVYPFGFFYLHKPFSGSDFIAILGRLFSEGSENAEFRQGLL